MSQFLYAPSNLRTGWQQYRSAHDAALNRQLGEQNQQAGMYANRAQNLGARADATRSDRYNRRQTAISRISASLQNFTARRDQKKAQAKAEKGSGGWLGLGGSLGGMALGAALAPATGGASMLAGAAVGGMIGGGVGGAVDATLAGGSPAPGIQQATSGALSAYMNYEAIQSRYPTAGSLRGGGGYPAIDLNSPDGGDWSMVDPYSRNF